MFLFLFLFQAFSISYITKDNLRFIGFERYSMMCGTNQVEEHNALENVNVKEVIIPSRVNDLPVVIIGQYAFRFYNQDCSIEKIFIPYTVQQTNFDAVAYMPSLKEIIIEQNSHLHVVGQGFLYRTSIEHFFLPINLVYIGPAFLSSPILEEFIYCGNQHFEEESLFVASGLPYYPKTFYVNRHYPYNNFGNFTNLIRSSKCDIYLPHKNAYQSKGIHNNFILFIILL